MATNRSKREAFTLLELLVVVAVIAMLSAMLFPSLSAAREKAKQVVCASQLRAVAQAAVNYGLEYNDAIPGSPLTSGMHFTQSPGNDIWKPGDSVTGWYDFSGAVLPKLTSKWSKDRKKLISRLTQGHFHCPSNAETYGPYPQDSNYPVIQAVSYLTMNTFMRGGPGLYRKYLGTPPKGITVDDVWRVAWPEDYGVQMPDGYRPRFGLVGNSGLKVLLADGFRYFDAPSTMDYCVWQKSFAGNQSAQPPCDIESREYGEMKAAKHSYRHGKGDTINAAFFDGHVASLTKKSSRNPDHYFPSGSTVIEESGLYSEWQRGNGTRLP